MPRSILVAGTQWTRPATAFVAIAIFASCGVQGDDLIAPVNNSPHPYSDIAGTWHGTVTQPGFGTYTMNLVVDGNAALTASMATVTYPELGCDGVWTGVGANGPTYTTIEHITAQHSFAAACLDIVDVQVVYSTNPRQLAISFVTGPAASAILTPQ